MNKDQQQALIAAYERIAEGYREASKELEKNLAKHERGEIADEDCGWVPWHGGEMPVPMGKLVDVEFGDGHIERNVPAGDVSQGKRSAISWHGRGGSHTIVAYRLAEPRQDEPHKDYGLDEPVAAANLSSPATCCTIGRIYRITHTHSDGDFDFIDDEGNESGSTADDDDWQLLYPGKVYAQAPLEGCPGYATPGMCYEVRKEHGLYFRILDDEGDHCLFTWNDSYQINGQNWTRIIPENL